MDRFTAATYAPLIMYAWDMCDADLRKIPPKVDPRIPARGWKINGFLSAGDDILKAGNSIRTTVLGAGDRVCYGYTASRQNEMVVVIRGTDGAEEWGDDLVFLMRRHSNPTVPGFVDDGFFSIYATMHFHPVGDPTSAMPVVDGIKSIVGTNQVRVLGHSLGAALATYLTLDLNLAGCKASACLFASPRTGNTDFVEFFETKVSNYDLFNYERDVVPKVPNIDILHLSRYRDLHQAKSIPAASSAAIICDNPPCNHHLICYTALLDPAAYQVEMADSNVVQDDRNCARCVESPIVP
jgi:triacylglycerol lipase